MEFTHFSQRIFPANFYKHNVLKRIDCRDLSLIDYFNTNIMNIQTFVNGFSIRKLDQAYRRVNKRGKMM